MEFCVAWNVTDIPAGFWKKLNLVQLLFHNSYAIYVGAVNSK